MPKTNIRNKIIVAMHQQRLAKFSDWWNRLVVWCAAIFAGLVVVGFSFVSEYAYHLFDTARQYSLLLPLIITPLGGMVIIYLTRRIAPMAAGSGIPQVMSAINEKSSSPEKISRFVSIRLSYYKVVFGTLGLLSGFSIGREGPSVQIAAGVMFGFRRFFTGKHKIQTKDLILAGGAAGVAAAFNTPLAGIIFAIEELSRRFEQRASGVIMTAIVLSGIVAISWQGNYAYFGRLQVVNLSRDILLEGFAVAVVAGVLGGLFSRLILMSSQNKLGVITHLRQRFPVYFAGACGLVVAILGLISHDSAHGSGYELAQTMLQGESPTHSSINAVVKFSATMVSYWSGIPGGIFSPALSIGASIGHAVAQFFQSDHGVTIMALGMVAFLAAVTQAPITSFIIVMEMIDSHSMVISLIATAFFATIISRVLSAPLYETLSRQQLAVFDPPPQGGDSAAARVDNEAAEPLLGHAGEMPPAEKLRDSTPTEVIPPPSPAKTSSLREWRDSLSQRLQRAKHWWQTRGGA